MRRLRLSAINFVNTAPLMWDFERGPDAAELAAQFDVCYRLPSACAHALARNAADLAIIPAAEYARIPGLRIIPGVAIAARGPVDSIFIVSKVPWEQARTIAADTSSRSSVALTQVICRKWLGSDPEFRSAPPVLEDMLRQNDAALIIGDPALRLQTTQPHVYDLAAEWVRLAAKPFVFAFWAVRGESASADLEPLFKQSRDHGLQHVTEIAEAWSTRLQLPPQRLERYLTRNIHYQLDPECLAGLRLFYQLAAEHEVLPAAPELLFT